MDQNESDTNVFEHLAPLIPQSNKTEAWVWRALWPFHTIIWLVSRNNRHIVMWAASLGHSWFHAVDSGLQKLDSSICQKSLDSQFQSLVEFRISWAAFRIPKPRIPDSIKKIFPNSWIPESGPLTRGEFVLNEAKIRMSHYAFKKWWQWKMQHRKNDLNSSGKEQSMAEQ